MWRRHKVAPGQSLVLIRGSTSYLLIGTSKDRFSLCIEHADGEICQGVGEGDLIAVSAPEGGPLEPAISLLELVRTYHLPVVVLPKGHPGSRRLRYVLAAGPRIALDCAIQRGTHPEQHLLCGGSDLSMMVAARDDEGLLLENVPEDAVISCIEARLSLTLSFGCRGEKTVRGGLAPDTDLSFENTH